MMQPFNLKPLCLPSVSSIRGFVGICKQIPSLPSELYVSIHLFPCIFISVLCIYITAEYDAAVPEAEREQLKGGAFEGVLGAAQEAIVISPWIAIAVRPKPGVWEYLRVDVSKLAVEELSVLEYLQFKEQLVEGRLRPSYHSGTGASSVRVVEVHPSSSTRNSPTALRSPWLWRG